ncbi:hypothetical protein R1flu_011025 [Riccia fluitans]|uniref:Uncharacterized protein n=1 Tax=Riccia fluitans TaxID=41844 RepID=A0ABD1Z6M7_9MARC
MRGQSITNLKQARAVKPRNNQPSCTNLCALSHESQPVRSSGGESIRISAPKSGFKDAQRHRSEQRGRGGVVQSSGECTRSERRSILDYDSTDREGKKMIAKRW